VEDTIVKIMTEAASGWFADR